MNKNNTSLNLIQNFLSEVELKTILQEFCYEDTARTCTVATVMTYLIHAATHEWKSLRHAADVGPSVGLISIDHSSLSKHMKRLDYAIMKRIFEVVVGKTRLPWAVYHGERAGISRVEGNLSTLR